MAQVTGLTATRMLAIEAASIVQAELSGDNLVLKNRGGQTVLNVNVRGPKGDTGDTGPAGDVASGGYVGTLQDAVNEAAATSLAQAEALGKGLVAYAEYGAANQVNNTGLDDTYVTVTNLSLPYSFVTNRSYRIDFGLQILGATLSDHENRIELELLRNGSAVRRVTMPGEDDGNNGGVQGFHFLKQAAWSGESTLTLRVQKRRGGWFTINNTLHPAFIAVTDLGANFVP